MPITVTGAGTISAVGEAQVGEETITAAGTGPDGTTRQIEVGKNYEDVTEPASVTATQAGSVDLTVRLTDAAKAKLAAGKHLQLILRLNSPGSGTALAMFVPLAAG